MAKINRILPFLNEPTQFPVPPLTNFLEIKKKYQTSARRVCAWKKTASLFEHFGQGWSPDRGKVGS